MDIVKPTSNGESGNGHENYMRFLRSDAANNAPLAHIVAVTGLANALGFELDEQCYHDLLTVLATHAPEAR